MKAKLSQMINIFSIPASSRLALVITAASGVITVCSIALTLSAGASSNRDSINAVTAEPSSPTATLNAIAPVRQNSFPGERPEVVIITLRPWGFEPSTITKAHSRLVLRVDNRSGRSVMSLQLDRQAGNRVKEVHIPFQKLDWSGEVDLPPGQYELREANHPDWTCAITITSR